MKTILIIFLTKIKKTINSINLVNFTVSCSGWIAIRLYLIFLIFLLNLLIFLSNNLSASFLQYNWSPKSAGMGGAFVAVSNDINSIVTNPAGLCKVKNYSILLAYDKPFMGITDINISKNSFLFGMNKFNIGVFGLDYTNFGITEYNESSIGLSYSKDIEKFFSGTSNTLIGVNVRLLMISYTTNEMTVNDPVFVLGGKSRTGFSIDAGLISEVDKEKLPGFTLGALLKNLNSPDMGLYTEDKVPMEIRAGLGYGIETLKFALDGSIRNSKIGYNLGLEGNLLDKKLFLRTGINKEEITFGFSFNFNKELFGLSLDYAFGLPLYIEDSNGNHRVGLGINF